FAKFRFGEVLAAESRAQQVGRNNGHSKWVRHRRSCDGARHYSSSVTEWNGSVKANSQNSSLREMNVLAFGRGDDAATTDQDAGHRALHAAEDAAHDGAHRGHSA